MRRLHCCENRTVVGEAGKRENTNGHDNPTQATEGDSDDLTLYLTPSFLEAA